MPNWKLDHSADWTHATATTPGGAGSTTGAGDGGAWTDTSGLTCSVAGNAAGTLSALRFISGGYNGPTLAYDPAAPKRTGQRLVVRIPPTPTAQAASWVLRLRYDVAANSGYDLSFENNFGTTVGCNLYVITGGGLTKNWGLVMYNTTADTANRWYDLEAIAEPGAAGGTDLSANLYDCDGPDAPPCSGTWLNTGTRNDTVGAALQGPGGYGLSVAGTAGLVARAWVYESDTAESFTASPASLVTGVAGQTLTLTGTNSAWTAATPWAFDGGTITASTALSPTRASLTVAAGATPGTFTLSDGTASTAVTLAPAGPITPGNLSVTAFGPAAIKFRTTAPAGGANRVKCDLYASTDAFFTPPGAGTLVAPDATPGVDYALVPPPGSKADDVYYLRGLYRDGTSSPAVSAQAQTPVGHAPLNIVAVGTSITARQSSNFGSAIPAVCGPISVGVNNQGRSGSTIANWLKADPDGTGYYAGLVALANASKFDLLAFEMGSNDLFTPGDTESVYQAFKAACRQFLTDFCGDCPSITSVLVSGIPYDYRPRYQFAAGQITATEAARRVANCARFQSLPADLAGAYGQATAKAGATSVYGATALDESLIDDQDHVHPTAGAGQLLQQQELAAALRDAFVAPPPAAAGGGGLSLEELRSELDARGLTAATLLGWLDTPLTVTVRKPS